MSSCFYISSDPNSHSSIPHAQSCPAPNAGWPGIQAESHPASSHFPSHSQIIPMNIQPIQALPLLPSPLQTSQMNPFGQYPCFFLPMPKIPSNLH